jgi:hypothetical protein
MISTALTTCHLRCMSNKLMFLIYEVQCEVVPSIYLLLRSTAVITGVPDGFHEILKYEW